jgi:hypothetical protein
MSDLQRFLETSYGDIELRTLVFAVFGDSPAMHASVPGSGASVQELALHIAVNLSRHYERPPAALWAHLLRTRGHRATEIRQIGAAFGVDLEALEVTAPTSASSPTPVHGAPPLELRSVLPIERRGSCDLLRCPRPPGDAATEESFVALRPGVTNGVARLFALEWTDRELALRTTPSVFHGCQPLAPRIELALPLYAEDFLYFPLGKDHCTRAEARPALYHFTIERWDRQARSVAFTARSGLRWRIDLAIGA